MENWHNSKLFERKEYNPKPVEKQLKSNSNMGVMGTI